MLVKAVGLEYCNKLRHNCILPPTRSMMVQNNDVIMQCLQLFILLQCFFVIECIIISGCLIMSNASFDINNRPLNSLLILLNK